MLEFQSSNEHNDTLRNMQQIKFDLKIFVIPTTGKVKGTTVTCEY